MAGAAFEEGEASRGTTKSSILNPLMSSNPYTNGYGGIPTEGDVVVDTTNDDVLSDASTSTALNQIHGTTDLEAFLSLMKGYIGPGMLSLPWAMSQLGLYYGCMSIFLMGFWSSYNCWTVVKLKHFIERTEGQNLNADENSVDNSPASTKLSSRMERMESVSVASSRTNLTFPDVGEWAFGKTFHSFVSVCVCTQQLAICTVFISFIGENLLAVLNRLNVTGFVGSHVGVMTLILPFVMSLSFLPSMKRLAPVMGMGFVLLVICLILLGVIMVKEWDERPDDLPELDLPRIPLAACAILYSYEGICLILPIESSMKEPKHFKTVFVSAMSLCALILAIFSTICIIVFGDVTNGSMTAFLVEAYRDDPSVTWYLMGANTAISLSVLFTYPLMLFPALELIGTSGFARWIGCLNKPFDQGDEDSLSVFDPMPVLPEHDVAEDSLPSEHQYGIETNNESINGVEDKDDDAKSLFSQSIVDMLPKMIMTGDSIQLRAYLVVMTYSIAVVVPNVQVLISLVGALAGSSTALLIPPLLELAYLHTLEEHRKHKTDANGNGNVVKHDDKNSSNNGNTYMDDPLAMAALPPSPRFVSPGAAASFRKQEQPQKTPFVWFGGNHWATKIKNYMLFTLGLAFAGIGTYASLEDIARIYYKGKK
mmetsp:Transcript_2900/g.3894  ORF Transcript_2900/g.3894 Transcript_2900/m.3894 type:complete len:652 (+) Transcript_2900:138-2093(+)|eukprot:CAMPEP_0198146118 /NCGR_PEP_ID=MMETSP1443-20131203/27511_1 /TAXON_ID=186043 /ORGANISM="Entomoneis sp., Strain CCMP2396" /LENGTH=651 /DNA_ID=CAMNT_0043809959 /DNA_START=73 /DNA_END=2028 /DNA_ORIENTATION=-